ncbi:hypothetical protein [Mycobacterium sp. E796]|uniref:hypothetical protein n=1 Tax=Mycobacterium sp. E796 TaxID=1834151 RepID=UPI000800C76E|nr:hypothetical protein [Mycobacterium sp. E796]OBI42317.1 hypothetical protein A5706_06650 [Mycobacterium sp. E796]
MDRAFGDDGSARSVNPVRCELIPVPSPLDEVPPPPPLILDFGVEGAIGVVDGAERVVASRGLAQIDATPARYARMVPDDPEGPPKKEYTQSLLLLQVPGAPALRIGTAPLRDSAWSGKQFRYAWRRNVARSSIQGPTHLVTEDEWLNLVGRLGLGALVVDEYASGKLDRRERFAMVYGLALLALFLAAVVALLVWLVIHEMH